MVLHEPLGTYAFMRDHPENVATRPEMRQFCRRRGLRLRSIPYDWRSPAGIGLANRRGLSKAVSLVRAAKNVALIIHDLDKLCLRVHEVAVLMLAFRDWQVPVWETKTGSDLTSQHEQWLESWNASDAATQAEASRAMIELKKRATRLSKRTLVGRRPFGELPGEKTVLEQIWKLRRKQRDGTGRTPYNRIAEILNKEGVKARQGKKWYARTVQGIVMRTKPHLGKD